MTHDLDGFVDEPRFERFTPTHDGTAVDDLDPSFVFDFHAYDDLESDTQRWSTWLSVEPLSRGPEPRPDWVVTSQGAVDTELGILKTGKEADVFLPRARRARGAVRGDGRQALPRGGDPVLPSQRRPTPRAARPGVRAIPARWPGSPPYGRSVAAGQWAWAEWEALKRLWLLGVPVPYPVQIDGTEILMEFVTVDGDGAPRLAQDATERSLLESYFEQLREAMAELARHGLVHGGPLAVQHPRGG
jgi:RIO kinase 1